MRPTKWPTSAASNGNCILPCRFFYWTHRIEISPRSKRMEGKRAVNKAWVHLVGSYLSTVIFWVVSSSAERNMPTHLVHCQWEQEVDIMGRVIDGLLNETERLQMFWRNWKTDSISNSVVKSWEAAKNKNTTTKSSRWAIIIVTINTINIFFLLNVFVTHENCVI